VIANQDPISWLKREVQALLQESHVGLYEFIWLLRGEHPEMIDVDMQKVAESSLKALLSSGHDLAWFHWPSAEPVSEENRPISELTDVWKEPNKEENYLALR
jgi:hypothetical protein